MKTRRSISRLGKVASATCCVAVALLLARSFPGDRRVDETANAVDSVDASQASKVAYLNGMGTRFDPASAKSVAGAEAIPDDKFNDVESESNGVEFAARPLQGAEFDFPKESAQKSNATTNVATTNVAIPTPAAPTVVAWKNDAKREEWGKEIRLPAVYKSSTTFADVAAPRWNDAGDAEFEAYRRNLIATPDFDVPSNPNLLLAAEPFKFVRETTSRKLEVKPNRTSVGETRPSSAPQPSAILRGGVNQRPRVGSFIAGGSYDAGSGADASGSAKRY